jgi:hypothetical protein
MLNYCYLQFKSSFADEKFQYEKYTIWSLIYTFENWFPDRMVRLFYCFGTDENKKYDYIYLNRIEEIYEIFNILIGEFI